MKSRLVAFVTCVTLFSLCHATPLFYNMSMDGSGDEAELELLFPISFSTRAPVQVTAATGPPSLTNTITTTMIRLKDFVLTRVVDFLQENLLIIIVVTSLLIVMVFIICCASAMSHKRKLEAYKPPPNAPRKYAADKTGGRKNSSELQERPYAVDHVKGSRLRAWPPPRTCACPPRLWWERGVEMSDHRLDRRPGRSGMQRRWESGERSPSTKSSQSTGRRCSRAPAPAPAPVHQSAPAI
ncbi:hypothetical protein D5F01_LYC09513 [Larimichthys crocea]|uniref:Transmembrane protein 119 n=1 Tax=Larimichthys crocea TaxID=215358 RepID=A0A6G0ILD9_LARCR|nr:hypothetical protein D5F01_LYC09513 [Larimichthys crocea]